MIAAIIATTLGTIATAVAIPVIVAALTAAATLLVTRASEAANLRRDKYAAAIETLVAWIEFPYRVRRRTDDEPQTLTALANLGHDLQERLACHQAWIATESSKVAEAYDAARRSISSRVGPAIQEAWNGDTVTAPEQMNLGDWGPSKDSAADVASVQKAITQRFGWARAKAFFS